MPSVIRSKSGSKIRPSALPLPPTVTHAKTLRWCLHLLVTHVHHLCYDTAIAPASTLAELRADFLQWQGCELATQARHVFGHGHPQADVVFVGEAPGKREDELQIPFVGAAGRFLDTLLTSIGLKREDVYITNVVKFRPPENRDPTPTEKRQCLPWLERELDVLQPTVIVPLGRHALTTFLPDARLAEVHGTPYPIPATLHRRATTLFPSYHPAAALYNGALRQTMMHDFATLRQLLDRPPRP